jgi:thioredoxin reductase (NADPH)
LGEKAISIDAQEDGSFIVTTESGTQHKAPNIAIAGGLGVFEPRKPPVEHLDLFETKGIDYIIKEPQKYKDKRLVIAGGGDSALDWTIYLQELAKEITLVHRSGSFRGHPDSVQKVMDLNAQGKIKLKTYTEVKEIKGNERLTSVRTFNKKEERDEWIETDYFLPLFGLSPKLGPIADWDLEIEKNAIKVNTLDYSTNIPGIYAIGDINTYEGKLKLILCGFHEATLMVQSAFKRIYPDKNLVLKYTTVNGVNGF